MCALMYDLGKNMSKEANELRLEPVGGFLAVGNTSRWRLEGILYCDINITVPNSILLCGSAKVTRDQRLGRATVDDRLHLHETL